MPLVYKDTKLDCGYRVDFLVDGRVVVELKSVEALAPIHDAIVLTYLRLSGCRIGLLINFNVSVLRESVRRLVLNYTEPEGKGLHRRGAENAEQQSRMADKNDLRADGEAKGLHRRGAESGE